jgi:ABC-type transport system substrate-binding protein
MKRTLLVLVIVSMAAVTAGGSLTAGASNTSNRVGAQKPQHGGEVTEAVADAFSGWIPDNALIPIDINILPAVYGTLVSIKANGKGVEPMLAESLEFDGTAQTLTVHLQPDAKFSDGKQVTSADVAFSVEQWKAGPNFGAIVSTIESVETPDPQTAIFHLTIPDTYLSKALAMSNFVVMPENFGGLSADEYFQKPVGAGPFMIDSETVGDELVLVPNPEYFDKDLPYLDKLTLKFIADPNQRSLQFQSGDVDFISPPLPFEEAQQFSDDEVTYIGNSNISQDLIANWTREPGSDENFRRALSLALDREKLAAGLFDGKALPAQTSLPPNVPNQVPPDVGKWPPYNPKKAKSLLEKSSYDGEELSIIIAATQGNTTLIAQAVQDQLADVGIETKLERLDIQSWIDRWYGSDYDLTMTYNTGQFPSAGLYMGVIATPFGFLASGAPNDIAVEQFDNFRIATTNAQRDDAVRAVENWAFENVAYVPIVDTDLPFVVKSDVHVPENGIAIYPFWKIWREQ